MFSFPTQLIIILIESSIEGVDCFWALRKVYIMTSIVSTWLPSMGASQSLAGQASMQTGYGLATSLLGDVMVAEAPSQKRALQSIAQHDKPEVLVVDGDHDHIHHVLEAASVPHARIAKAHAGHLRDALSMVPEAKALLINCAEKFPKRTALAARDFVQAGGLLLTTDWALKPIIEVAFPGTISHNGRRTAGNVFVTVDRMDLDHLPGPQSRVLTKLGEQMEQPRWWLESASWPFHRHSDDVQILLHSSELKTQYGRGSVVVRWPHGKGWVYHMISHAYLQRLAPPTFQALGMGEGVSQTQVWTTSLGASAATSQAYAQAEQVVPDFSVEAASNTAVSMMMLLAPVITALRPESASEVDQDNVVTQK
jgi:hypothetical protein